eukprot:TRINITY_DN11438_c0_g1_i3.p1 TRINITY_DN11438_c0_g1~~TRINITY_DN11438_c0_g1_i3.p1  ORF type:complete len:101 (-),score=12.86 TRINITY_DN11438_c0_g1_i3:440-742(-)
MGTCNSAEDPEERPEAASPSRPSKSDSRLKILIIGESDAGKTSLVDRLVLGVYNPHTPATVSVDPHRKDLIIDQREWNLDIYDTPGQERFRAIAQCALLV